MSRRDHSQSPDSSNVGKMPVNVVQNGPTVIKSMNDYDHWRNQQTHHVYGLSGTNGANITGDYVTPGAYYASPLAHHPPPLPSAAANINSPSAAAYYSTNNGGAAWATNFYAPPHQLNAAAATASPVSPLQYTTTVPPAATVDHHMNLFGSNSYLLGYLANSQNDYSAWASPFNQQAAAAAAAVAHNVGRQAATTTTSNGGVVKSQTAATAPADFYGYGSGAATVAAGLHQQPQDATSAYASFATAAPPADMLRPGPGANLLMYNHQHQLEHNFGRLSFDDPHQQQQQQQQQSHHQHLQAAAAAAPLPPQPRSVHQMMGAVGLGLGPAPSPAYHHHHAAAFGGPLVAAQATLAAAAASAAQATNNQQHAAAAAAALHAHHQQFHQQQPPQSIHQQPQAQAPAKKTWASIVKQPEKNPHQQQSLGQVSNKKKIPTAQNGPIAPTPSLAAAASPPTSAAIAVAPPAMSPTPPSPQPLNAYASSTTTPYWTPAVGSGAPTLVDKTPAAGDTDLTTNWLGAVVNGQRTMNSHSFMNDGGGYALTSAYYGDGIGGGSSGANAVVNGASDSLTSAADDRLMTSAAASRRSTTTLSSASAAGATPVGARGGGAKASSTKNVGDGDGGAAVGPPSSVLERLRRENDYNPREFNLPLKDARYYVIKSYNEDDFHRSIKYGIWCSTEHGNKRLDQTYKEREGKGPVYIFASVNGSGHFCGVARMTSPVDYCKSVGVWAQDKYKGQFSVKWIYVKDVPNSQLRHIRLENNENKPVTNSRDTQEVPAEKGRQVLKIIHNYQHTTSLFDDFTHYEKREREEEDRKKRSQPQQQQQQSHR